MPAPDKKRFASSLRRPSPVTKKDYATGRASFRYGEIRVLDCDGAVQRNFGIDMWFMSGHAPRPIGVQVNPRITEGN